MGKMTDQAFVTLATNDVYCLGALVLANSLRLVNTTRELVVIITPMVTQEMRNHLNSVYDVVVCVDVLESNDQANLALSRRPELGVTFTKINCWKLTQYKKCVFLDSDCLVIKNCDELFDREELSAVPDIGWPDCFNSGVFVYVPSLETYQKLLDLAIQQGSFDGGDQGLLNTFFSSWATKDIAKHLSFIYNMASSATYTYLPAYKRFMKDVKIIHYLGAIKPWNFTCDYSTGRVSVGGLDCYRANHIQTWWDVYMKHVHALLDTRHKSLLGTPPASLSSGSRSDPPPRLMSDKEHKDAWEGGHIDYMGTDAFENIQRHIESQVQSTNMNTFLASWNSGGEKEVKIKSGNGEGWEGGQSSALFPGSYNKGFEFGAAQSSYVNTNPPNPNPIPIISPTPGYISLTFPPKSGKERKKSAIKKIQQTLPQTVPHELDHPKCETVSTQLDSATSEFFIGDSSSDYGELNHHVTFSPTLTLFDRSADEGYITPRSVIVSTFVPMIQETPEIQHHPSQIPIMISNLGAELNGANNGNLNHEQSEQQNLPLQPDHNLGLKVDNYERDDLSSSEKQARSLKDPKQGIDVTRDIEVFAKTLQNTITGDVLKEKDGMAQAAEAKSVKATAALNDIQPYANTHTSEHFSNALNPIVDYDPEYLSSFVPKKENKSNMHETELPQTIIPLSPSISKIVKRQIKPLNFDPNFTFEGLDESQSKQSVIPIDEEAKGDMEMSASLRSMQSPSKSNETSQLTFTIDESSGKALESLKELDTFSDDRLVIPPLPDKAIIEVTTVKLRCEAGQLGDGDKQTELVEVQLKPQPLTPLSLDSSRLMQHKFSKDNYTQDLKVRNSNSITTYIPRTEIERRIEARNKTRHREILDTNSLNTITTRVPHPQASEALHAVSFSVTIKDRGGREVTKKSYEIGGGSWRDRTHKSPMALDKTARTFERSPSPVTSVASAAIADDELSWSLQDGLSSQPEARSVHSFSSNTSTNSFINPYASSESFVILERGKSSAGFELPLETRTQEADAIKAPPNQTHVINSVRLNKVIEDINLLPPPQYSLPLSPPQTPDPVEDFHRPTPMNIVTYLPDNLKDLNYSSQLNFKPEANERAGIEISSRLIPTTVSPPPEPLKTKPEKGGKTLAQPTSETNTGIGYQSYIKDTLGKLFR